jgi:hypothetical protein
MINFNASVVFVNKLVKVNEKEFFIFPDCH